MLTGVVLVLVLCSTTYDYLARDGGPIAPLLVRGVLVGYASLARTLVWTLMDEVCDGGDGLLVKRGAAEDKLYFVDIQDVIDRSYSRPPRLVLKLRGKSKFGRSVAFVPTTDRSLFEAGMSVVRELRHRSRRAEARD